MVYGDDDRPVAPTEEAPMTPHPTSYTRESPVSIESNPTAAIPEWSQKRTEAVVAGGDLYLRRRRRPRGQLQPEARAHE